MTLFCFMKMHINFSTTRIFFLFFLGRSVADAPPAEILADRKRGKQLMNSPVIVGLHEQPFLQGDLPNGTITKRLGQKLPPHGKSIFNTPGFPFVKKIFSAAVPLGTFRH